jgi:hypothetical protein
VKNIIKSRLKQPEAEEYGSVRSDELRNESRSFRDVFTPCPVTGSLIEKSCLAAKNALSGYVILFSPACSSFDQFRENQGVEEVCPRTAKSLAPTICGGKISAYHNMQPVDKRRQNAMSGCEKNLRLAPGFFEEKPRRKITTLNIPHHERTLKSANYQ